MYKAGGIEISHVDDFSFSVEFSSGQMDRLRVRARELRCSVEECVSHMLLSASCVPRDKTKSPTSDNSATAAKSATSAQATEIDEIDWKLLRGQKLRLVELANRKTTTKKPITPAQKDALDGVINLLDSLQDDAAEALGEAKVFGDAPERKE